MLAGRKEAKDIVSEEAKIQGDNILMGSKKMETSPMSSINGFKCKQIVDIYRTEYSAIKRMKYLT